MSSALGMNLMPPTSAFQHGLQQATSAAVAQQSQQSSETNLDRDEHEPSSQDSAKAQLASEHNIAAKSNVISGEYFGFFFNQSKSHIKVSYFSTDNIQGRTKLQACLPAGFSLKKATKACRKWANAFLSSLG